jgi:uncharacterized protein (TIGR02001 family)
MKRAFIAAALAGTAFVAAAQALTFNVGAVSDYRYRGISQSRLKPALQGGVDYALPSGFYIGTWASTIRWIRDAGTIGSFDAGGTNVEWDLYGGYKGEIRNGLGFDVGVLAYVYPNNNLNPSADTTEIYGALSFGPATVKYSHSVTNLFGFRDSTNSGYLDISATFDIGSGFSLTPHLGYQHVAKNSDYSYTDYSLTISKDIAGFGLSAALVGTDTKKIAGGPAYFSPAGKDLGKAGVVLGAKKSF